MPCRGPRLLLLLLHCMREHRPHGCAALCCVACSTPAVERGVRGRCAPAVAAAAAAGANTEGLHCLWCPWATAAWGRSSIVLCSLQCSWLSASELLRA